MKILKDSWLVFDNETDLSSFIPQDEVLDDFEEDLNSGSGESDVPVEQDAGFLGLTGAAIADVIGGNPWISTLILILLILAFMQLFTSRKPLKGFKK